MIFCFKCNSIEDYKINELDKKFLLAGDEMYLKQSGLSYSAFGSFIKNKERIQTIWDINYIYKNELHKACFQHDMAYRDFKHLGRRKWSDKVLRDKAFSIAINSKYDGYQKSLASMVYKCFDKKSAGSGI